jgi:hypothetical protein
MQHQNPPFDRVAMSVLVYVFLPLLECAFLHNNKVGGNSGEVLNVCKYLQNNALHCQYKIVPYTRFFVHPVLYTFLSS